MNKLTKPPLNVHSCCNLVCTNANSSGVHAANISPYTVRDAKVLLYQGGVAVTASFGCGRELNIVNWVLYKLQCRQSVSGSLLRIYSAFCRYELSTFTVHSLLYKLFLKWSRQGPSYGWNPLPTRETNERVTTIRRAFIHSFE